MSYFVSFSLLGFTFVIKLRSFDFESHYNSLIFSDKKIYIASDLDISRRKMSAFVSFPLLMLTLVIKLRIFDSECH